MSWSDAIARLLDDLPARCVAVIGDLGVDRTLRVDRALQDRSVETNLPIRQVVDAHAAPGGAGTVVANLLALGVGCVRPVSLLGDDPEGAWLREWLERPGIDARFVERAARPTPAWIRPIHVRRGSRAREGHRLDCFARESLPADVDARWCQTLARALEGVDAVVVSDYEEAGKVGVLSEAARATLVALAEAQPGSCWLADSRLRPGAFDGMLLSPNARELNRLVTSPLGTRAPLAQVERAARELAGARGRAVFVKLGRHGLAVAEPGAYRRWRAWPGAVTVDPVGAGDAVNAGVAAALAAGAAPALAGLLGLLAASVTVEQIGWTGTAPAREVAHRAAAYEERYGHGTQR